jgi:hypothetical protein
MTLTLLGIIVAAVAGSWLLLTLTVVILDHRERAADRHRLEVREWKEKVDAMRRLQDRDGDA